MLKRILGALKIDTNLLFDHLKKHASLFHEIASCVALTVQALIANRSSQLKFPMNLFFSL